MAFEVNAFRSPKNRRPSVASGWPPTPSRATSILVSVTGSKRSTARPTAGRTGRPGRGAPRGSPAKARESGSTPNARSPRPESPADGREIALRVLRRVFTQGAFASTVLRHELTRTEPATATDPASDPISATDRPATPEAPALPEERRPFAGEADPSDSERRRASDKALATEIVYGVLRRRHFLDRAVSRAAGKRLKDLDPRLHDVLRVAAYQLAYLERVPDHAAVDQAVEQAKRRLGTRGAGTANAILRRLAELPPDHRIPEPPSTRDPVERVMHEGGVPRELADLWVADLGPDRALAFARASLDPAPQTLRANLLRTTPKALAREVGGTPGRHERAVRLPHGGTGLAADLDAVRAGRATPQDEASMAVVDLLDPKPGEHILDLCAAPGGKTTCIAEVTEDRARIDAYDRLPDRLRQVPQNAARLGLSSIQTLEALPEPEPIHDRVLVDAPCSGLGTLRRHPEIRWKFRADELDRLVRTQRRVLLDGAERVRPGGKLVYSVCTVTEREGPAALDAVKDAFQIEQTWSTGPDQEGAPDGFFAACLKKR